MICKENLHCVKFEYSKKGLYFCIENVALADYELRLNLKDEAGLLPVYRTWPIQGLWVEAWGRLDHRGPESLSLWHWSNPTTEEERGGAMRLRQTVTWKPREREREDICLIFLHQLSRFYIHMKFTSAWKNTWDITDTACVSVSAGTQHFDPIENGRNPSRLSPAAQCRGDHQAWVPPRANHIIYPYRHNEKIIF